MLESHRIDPLGRVVIEGFSITESKWQAWGQQFIPKKVVYLKLVRFETMKGNVPKPWEDPWTGRKENGNSGFTSGQMLEPARLMPWYRVSPSVGGRPLGMGSPWDQNYCHNIVRHYSPPFFFFTLLTFTHMVQKPGDTELLTPEHESRGSSTKLLVVVVIVTATHLHFLKGQLHLRMPSMKQ